MKNRILFLVPLLSICALISLQRVSAEVTLSIVGSTNEETQITDTGDITFTLRITSEAEDSYNNLSVVAQAEGLPVTTEHSSEQIQTIIPDYPLEINPDTFSINGAGTQDITITLRRSEISKQDTISFTIVISNNNGDFFKYLAQAYTVIVHGIFHISLDVIGSVTKNLIVEEGLLLRGGKISDVTFTSKITNNQSINLKVDLTLPTIISFLNPHINSDKVRMSLTSVTLDPGASKEVTLTIPGSLFTIPGTFPSIKYGASYLTLVATPNEAPGSAKTVLFVINVIRPVANLYLDFLDGLTRTTTTDDIDDITYVLRVTNTGNQEDEIHFTISGDVGTAQVNPSRTVLSPDSYQDIILTISRAALSDAGMYNTIVTGHSVNNPRRTASVTTITTVTGDTPTPTNPTEPDLSTHEVAFSEFMFESAGGVNGLPQWLEVYNNSTSSINLRGWKLQWKRLKPSVLEATATFDTDFHIPPQQSRLIVTALGRHSANGALSDASVYQLSSLYAEELAREVLVSRLQIFSSGGFSLKLTNSKDVLIDHISTLSGDKKTWQLPECLINGVRSSLIRRFDEGVPRSGIERRGWYRAYDAKRVIPGLYYGSLFDLSTPGHRRGKPLPVELSQFSAKIVKDEVVINWTTESELDNAGFNIFRSTSRTKDFRRINTKLIQGAGTTGQRTAYQFIDKTAKPDVAYYYRLEDVDLSGKGGILKTYRLRGIIAPTGKHLTTWGTLKDHR